MGRRITAIDLDKFYLITFKFNDPTYTGTYESLTAYTGENLLKKLDIITDAIGLTGSIEFNIINDEFKFDFYHDLLENVEITEISEEAYKLIRAHTSKVNSSIELGYGLDYIADNASLKLMEAE